MRPLSRHGLARVILVVVLVLAGCSTRAPNGSDSATCAAPAHAAAGENVTFSTSDGWTLFGRWLAANASGPVFVLVHGLNEDHGSFDGLARDLSSRGASVLAFDLRGHGRSTPHDGRNETWHNFTSPDDFVAMDHDLGAASEFVAHATSAGCPLVFVGASIGANLALRFASDHVGTTQAVALLSAGVDDRGVGSEEAARNYSGRVLFLASEGDTYAAQSSQRLADESIASVHDVRIVSGSPHGTELLKSPDDLAALEAWLAAHA